jgi:hypothetical protein
MTIEGGLGALRLVDGGSLVPLRLNCATGLPNTCIWQLVERATLCRFIVEESAENMQNIAGSGDKSFMIGWGTAS